jgi:hypothetical membrane protein
MFSRRRDQRAPDIPLWAAVSAGAAPLLLAGGWTLAASRQPAGFDSVRDTISSLAARGASDRWIMTTALAGLGACYAVSALGLRPARPVGRLLLLGGGLATVLVAAFPQPAHGNSVAHTIAATAAFTSLAIWPVLAAGPHRALLLRQRAATPATVVMCGLVLWFVLEAGGTHRGLAERSAALAEALWPLLVVLSSRARAVTLEPSAA